MTGQTGALVSLSVSSCGHIVYTAHHAECALHRQVVGKFIFVVDAEVSLGESGVTDDTIVFEIAPGHVVVGFVVATVNRQTI